MSRIKDYPKTQSIAAEDVFVLDGDDGVRGATLETLTSEVLDLAQIQSEKYYDILDAIIPVEARRNTWRGRNLGSEVTEEQYDAIADGTFKGLFLGDYWLIDGVIWRIMDFDYWLNIGSTISESITTHHLVIIPDKIDYVRKMNDEPTTSNGFYTTYNGALFTLRSIIKETFGSNNILIHKELITRSAINPDDNSTRLVRSSTSVDVSIPNAFMVFGLMVYPDLESSSLYSLLNDTTYTRGQLNGFRIGSNMFSPTKDTWWLQDVVSDIYFSCVFFDGSLSSDKANVSKMMRPVFGLVKGN